MEVGSMALNEPSTLEPTSQSNYFEEFQTYLVGKSSGTIEVYLRIIRQFTNWLATKVGNDNSFQPQHLTKTAFETYLKYLENQGYSLAHRVLVKSATSSFAHFLIEEKGLLHRNPTRGVTVGVQALLAPRELTSDQRYILRNLVERAGDLRSQALFALGYWAGCRVSDVSWLLFADVHLTSKTGWLKIGYKGGKSREIDLVNQARKPLWEYKESHQREADSPYFFTSQRSNRLTEAGIHHWFRHLKTLANQTEGEQILNISFHDLRHDWAHRARQGGWNLEEIAYYLGHITNKGQPAIATTARYTQASREQVRAKLKLLDG
jgi:site-specific recombinase XerD